MRQSFRSGARALLLAASCVAALASASPSAAGGRDDTSDLQARLDAGGNVFIPKLPNGECYRTRGLWVSHDDTSITSDGACLVALGPGDVRAKGATGKAVRATAVFFLTHSDVLAPLPVRVTISGMRIDVPGATRMVGISIEAHEVTVDHVTIDGAPTTDVRIGNGQPAGAGITERVVIRDSNLSGGRRDVVTASGAIRLDIERNVIAGARALPSREPAAGVDRDVVLDVKGVDDDRDRRARRAAIAGADHPDGGERGPGGRIDRQSGVGARRGARHGEANDDGRQGDEECDSRP